MAMLLLAALLIGSLFVSVFSVEAQPKPEPVESDRPGASPSRLHPASELRPGGPETRPIERPIEERLFPSERPATTPKLSYRTHTFVPVIDAIKRMPDVLPAKVFLEASRDEVKGVMYFSDQPDVLVKDFSYRPSGKTEAREVKFLLARSELPIRLPAGTTKVSFEVPGNYMVLPSHAVYSMYAFATKKKDFDVANVLEQVMGKLTPKGVAVYAWSERKLDFVVYGQVSGPVPEYRGSVALIENIPDLTARINAVLAGYYWTNLAKFASTPGEREQLKALATTVLPKELVEQYIQAK